jgi:hypothetical protein
LFEILESKGDPSSGSAKELRLGVEKKSWIAKIEQSKLYSKRAQLVLDTVKVGNTISPTPERLINWVTGCRGKSIGNSLEEWGGVYMIWGAIVGA